MMPREEKINEFVKGLAPCHLSQSKKPLHTLLTKFYPGYGCFHKNVGNYLTQATIFIDGLASINDLAIKD